MEEKQIYQMAMEKFEHGRTWQITKEPLRDKLKREYAQFAIECWKRQQRTQSRPWLTDNH